MKNWYPPNETQMSNLSEWYSPRDIRFSPRQVLFLITNLPLLREGQYPPECKATGYTGISSVSHSHHAPFEMPVMLAAEIDTRLSCTSTDGLLLVAEAQAEMPLDYPAKMALRYISGWKRKKTDYPTYRSLAKHRDRKFLSFARA